MSAKATTFLAEETQILVDVLTGPASTGLCKVAYGTKILVRHIDRLTPVNEEARQILRKRA